jgi:hypothetical protein
MQRRIQLVLLTTILMFGLLGLAANAPAAAQSGGVLTGSTANPPASVNLSTEGTVDFAHWGLNSASDFNSKSGATVEISNFTKIGTATVGRYTNNPVSYSWTGGTPAASATNTTTGVYIEGLNNGFQFTVPADTNQRTLKVYVGVFDTRGELTATLSDNSAAQYVDSSLVTDWAQGNAVYTLTYRAASAGRTLTVRWINKDGTGNVTLQGATLAGGGFAPPTNTPVVPTNTPIPSATPTTSPGGGLLTGSGATSPASLNLSSEGSTDWAHWGLNAATDFNSKNGATVQINNITVVGSGSPARYDDNDTAFTWTGGTPTASATNTTTGIYLGGINNGLQFTVPADTTQRTLKVYVGSYDAQGRLQASLSDNSATAYTDTAAAGSANRVYTLNYRAASAGQTLTVRWTQVGGGGNVTLQAATLSGGGSNPTPVPTVTIVPGTSARSGAIYDAEAVSNTRGTGVVISPCAYCVGRFKVGNIGLGAANFLQFNNVAQQAAGTRRVIIYYMNGDGVGLNRTADISVNGGAPSTVTFPFTTPWPLPRRGWVEVDLPLNAGSNTIRFSNNTAYAPDIDMIIVLGQTGIADPVPPAGTPVAASGNCGAGVPRDKHLQPFSCDSIWNMPIGSNAVYVPAGIVYRTDTNGGLGTVIRFDEDWYYVTQASDPAVPWYSPFGFDTHCSGQFPNQSENAPAISTGTIKVPNDFLFAPQVTDPVFDTPNNPAAFLQPDGSTLIQMQPLARCEAGGPVYGYAAWNFPAGTWESIYGTGIYGGHFGSGLSSIGGALRVGELRPGSGPVRHALKLELAGTLYYYWSVQENRGYRWPADREDFCASSEPRDPNNPACQDSYLGTNPALRPGSLLAIPPNVTEASLNLETEPGRILFRTLQDYGGYIADDSGGDAFQTAVEGGFPEQFWADWGYSWDLDNAQSTAFGRDMVKLYTALYVVDNNGPNNIGGGGTPRAPLAPPIGN